MFDMQPHNGQTAPGHIAVYADTVYTDGRYGWLTRFVHDEFKRGGGGFELKYWDTVKVKSGSDKFLSQSDIPEPYKDGVWGKEDGVFRVVLPNGTYEVTCYFCAGEFEPLEINLIANGEKKIEKLRLPVQQDSTTPLR